MIIILILCQMAHLDYKFAGRSVQFAENFISNDKVTL